MRSWLAVLPFLLVSCGSILGLEDPTDRVGLVTGDGGVAVDGALACALNQKQCSGACVSNSDPTLGCGGGCAACPAPQNASAGCGTGAMPGCTVGACHAGFGDCNTDATDGCEAQLSTTTSCGDCKTNCVSVGKKYCTPQGGGKYDCTDACTPPNAVCNTECVDPRSDAKNCGNCGNDCTRPNGTGTCISGQCHVTCNDQFCPPSCVSDDTTCFANGCNACPQGTRCGPGGCTANTCVESNTACGAHCDIDCTTAPYGPNFTCGPAHSCVCPMTNQACGQTCVPCPATGACLAGVCGAVTVLCQGNEIMCDDVCVPKDASPNCGTCGNDCQIMGLECCLTGGGGVNVDLPLIPPVAGTGNYACVPPGPDAGSSCKP